MPNKQDNWRIANGIWRLPPYCITRISKTSHRLDPTAAEELECDSLISLAVDGSSALLAKGAASEMKRMGLVL